MFRWLPISDKVRIASNYRKAPIIATISCQKRLISSEHIEFQQTATQPEESSKPINHEISRACPRWSKEETDKLLGAVSKHGRDWSLIAEVHFGNARSTNALYYKWYCLKNNKNVQYKQWTPQEDEALIEAVEKFGIGKWMEIAKAIPCVSSSQAQRRWERITLDKRGRWTPQEDHQLRELVSEHGTQWTKISKILGRPLTSVHGHYNNLVAKINHSWTKSENKKLQDAIRRYGRDWSKITPLFPVVPLQSLKKHVFNSPSLNPDVNLGRWNSEETFRLREALDKHGKSWTKISRAVGTRTENQCYKHWYQWIRDPNQRAYRIGNL